MQNNKKSEKTKTNKGTIIAIVLCIVLGLVAIVGGIVGIGIFFIIAAIIAGVSGRNKSKNQVNSNDTYVIDEKYKSNLFKPELMNTNLPPLTEDYYNLLRDFTLSLVAVKNKIERARYITVPNYRVGLAIIYDMSQIFGMINRGRFDNHLENLGFSYFSAQIYAVGLRFEKLVAYEKEVFKLVRIWNATIFDELNKMYMFGVSDKLAKALINRYKERRKDLMLSGHTDKIVGLEDLRERNSPYAEEYATILYRFAVIIAKADDVEADYETILLSSIYKMLHQPNMALSLKWEITQTQNFSKIEVKNITPQKIDKTETLDDILNELNSLIGLNTVKEEINSLINYIKIQKEREKSGLKTQALSYHIVFTGNPGTGKTTVARLVAKIYKYLGILKTGHLVETDRSGLIGEYLGQTAVKVNKVVDSALHGVLFIDEAYSLVGEREDTFGKEAVATLIKRIEDDRDKLVLIIAGYTNEMNNFIETNPGFKSRFNRHIEFLDYTSEELFAIFETRCKQCEYSLTEGARHKVKGIIHSAYINRDKAFGNGRYVRNIVEKTMERQSNRLAKASRLTKDILMTITEEDIFFK